MINRQSQLTELAKINNTVSLPKKNIESFEIPKLLYVIQNKINETMSSFGSLIDSYLKLSTSENIFNILSPTS